MFFVTYSFIINYIECELRGTAHKYSFYRDFVMQLRSFTRILLPKFEYAEFWVKSGKMSLTDDFFRLSRPKIHLDKYENFGIM